MPALPALTSFEIPYSEPLDYAAALDFLRARALAGVESVTATAYARSLRLPAGPAVVEVRDAGGALAVDARLSDASDSAAAEAAVRRVFDVDAPAARIDATLARVPELAPRVAAHPGLRIPGAADAAELLVRAIVGQQITVVAATGMLTAMATEGEPIAGDGPIDRLFPTLDRIAGSAHRHYRGPEARRAALSGLADAVADDPALVADDPALVAPGPDPDAYRAALVRVRGIGAWTAAYIAIRVAGARDVLLPNDSAVRAGARLLGIDGRLDDVAAEVSPYRSSLTAHLWRAAADARMRS